MCAVIPCSSRHVHSRLPRNTVTNNGASLATTTLLLLQDDIFLSDTLSLRTTKYLTRIEIRGKCGDGTQRCKIDATGRRLVHVRPTRQLSPTGAASQWTATIAFTNIDFENGDVSDDSSSSFGGAILSEGPRDSSDRSISGAYTTLVRAHKNMMMHPSKDGIVDIVSRVEVRCAKERSNARSSC